MSSNETIEELKKYKQMIEQINANQTENEQMVSRAGDETFATMADSLPSDMGWLEDAEALTKTGQTVSQVAKTDQSASQSNYDGWTNWVEEVEDFLANDPNAYLSYLFSRKR